MAARLSGGTTMRRSQGARKPASNRCAEEVNWDVVVEAEAEAGTSSPARSPLRLLHTPFHAPTASPHLPSPPSRMP
ncbi:hypothetical protein PR202_ga29272 [Eleusine coracana subsp. coracana]|uniref:Uncharacterized protein n=1 Tax=Eleusine coracana subsp. coracana TaxID=191504 RepID=A0AAV5DKW7_ELECO|nr:hypothetical protein PR202_ga29272 [Eleusine coracana subsp. coracana]